MLMLFLSWDYGGYTRPLVMSNNLCTHMKRILVQTWLILVYVALTVVTRSWVIDSHFITAWEASDPHLYFVSKNLSSSITFITMWYVFILQIQVIYLSTLTYGTIFPWGGHIKWEHYMSYFWSVFVKMRILKENSIAAFADVMLCDESLESLFT